MHWVYLLWGSFWDSSDGVIGALFQEKCAHDIFGRLLEAAEGQGYRCEKVNSHPQASAHLPYDVEDNGALLRAFVDAQYDGHLVAALYRFQLDGGAPLQHVYVEPLFVIWIASRTKKTFQNAGVLAVVQGSFMTAFEKARKLHLDLKGCFPPKNAYVLDEFKRLQYCEGYACIAMSERHSNIVVQSLHVGSFECGHSFVPLESSKALRQFCEILGGQQTGPYNQKVRSGRHAAPASCRAVQPRWKSARERRLGVRELVDTWALCCRARYAQIPVQIRRGISRRVCWLMVAADDQL